MVEDSDVLIVGGGVAGLSAAIALGRGGRSVGIVEARERLGGRILTVPAQSTGFPIELGAEFIHGFSQHTWSMIEEYKLPVSEVEGELLCVEDGKIKTCDFFSDVQKLLDRMNDEGPDESFSSFLKRAYPEPGISPAQRKITRRALGYVTGFNAADPELIGIHWLKKEMRESEKIEGDRSFRLRGGYRVLLDQLQNEIEGLPIKVHMSTVAQRIVWKPGETEISVRADNGENRLLKSRCVLITVPLGVLKASQGQTGALQFAPDLPAEKLDALEKLEMGRVIRVVLQFRERFWEGIGTNNGRSLSNMSFLFSEHKQFPTWWTAMPEKYPTLTGWAPFKSADELSGRGETFIIGHALDALSDVLGLNSERIKHSFQAGYVHDWQNDPFSRGAYSYVKVGGEDAPSVLGLPVENTLFFAGEATDHSGQNGTVHGAIGSGRRAAAEILKNSMISR